MSPDPSLWSLLAPVLTTLAGGAVASGTLLVKSWIDRKTRGDAFSLKVQEARIAMYRPVQIEATKAFIACGDIARSRVVEIQPTVEQCDKALAAVRNVALVAAEIEHLFSPETTKALNDFCFDCAQLAGLLSGEFGVALKNADNAMSRLKEALRRDCRTAPLDAHVTALLPSVVSQNVEVGKSPALPSDTAAHG